MSNEDYDKEFMRRMTEMLNDDDYMKQIGDVARRLSESISRGTHHFDRDHSKEVIENCICDKNINPNCTVHNRFIR